MHKLNESHLEEMVIETLSVFCDTLLARLMRGEVRVGFNNE